jgi:hypothetical protein
MQDTNVIDRELLSPICAICNAAVELESSMTDGDGKAVHEECYFQKLHNTPLGAQRSSD